MRSRTPAPASISRLRGSDGPAGAAVVDLSANENPFGPSPRALAALAEEAVRVHRYPDEGAALERALATRLRVAPEQIVLGNGSCEVLEAIARATLRPGDRALLVDPSFPAYRSLVARTGAAPLAVAFGDDGEDLPALARRVCARTRLVVLANPNNPTGAMFGAAAWRRFLDAIPRDVVVAIDEAYGEYVLRPDYPRTLEDVARGHPVVVVRSFSKAYGLAGARLGYGIAAGPLRGRIAAQLQRYATSRLARAAALAALSDEEHLARCASLNAAGRRFLQSRLFGLGLEVPASEANFLLVRTPDAGGVCRRLGERGVKVKWLEGYGLPDAFRVSVGRPEENDRFVQALTEVLAPRAAASREGGGLSPW